MSSEALYGDRGCAEIEAMPLLCKPRRAMSCHGYCVIEVPYVYYYCCYAEIPEGAGPLKTRIERDSQDELIHNTLCSLFSICMTSCRYEDIKKIQQQQKNTELLMQTH